MFEDDIRMQTNMSLELYIHMKKKVSDERQCEPRATIKEKDKTSTSKKILRKE